MTVSTIEVSFTPLTHHYRFSSVTEYVSELPYNMNDVVHDKSQAGALLLLSNYGLDRLNADLTLTNLMQWDNVWR